MSAANRGKYILETYPQSQYDGDAVALLAVSYDRLGQKLLADDARRVLKQNYPTHPYLTGDWPKKRRRAAPAQPVCRRERVALSRRRPKALSRGIRT